MTAMRQLARYLGISDGNMQEGSMRCDVNVSVRKKGETLLGERCEIKNVNSMRFARQAIEFEVKRQVDLLENGQEIIRSTLNFNPTTGETSPMRDKESAHDYRYFPDPDLPPVVLTQQWVDEVADTLPELPQVLFKRFTNEFDLSENDARLLTNERETAVFFETTAKVCASHGVAGKAAANLFINKISPWLTENNSEIADFPVSAEQLTAYLKLIESGQVSASIANQRLFPELVKSPDTPPLELAQKLNLLQSADSDFLERIVDEVLAANPDKVAEYRKGKKGLIGFFMGEVMKKSQGKAEPKATNALVARKLG